MDFINKLIKRGIFGLVLCFSFFVFSNGENIKAENNCTIEINDGDKYLVLNKGLDWSDSGVSIYCNGVKQENVSVSINGGTPILTTDSGKDVSKNYLVNAGFYEIKYFLASDSSVFVTRQVRVLPEDLNSVRNLWLGDFEKNTTASDVFVKVVNYNKNYVAIGNFGSKGYVVYFDSRGQYILHAEYENVVLSDIANSGYDTGNVFFVVGQNEENKGFLKPVLIDNSGVRDYGSVVNFYSESTPENNATMINKVIVSGNYVYGAGYLLNNDATKTAKIVRLTKGGTTLTDVKYYSNSLDSEFKSIVATQDNGLKVVAVGNTSVSGYGGATGGLVTVCNEDLSSCATQDPYIWQNSNGASTTTTMFNDIVKQGENYLVVGKSRVDKVTGAQVTNNSGVEDSLVVMLNSSFAISDVYLMGSSSSDELYSIKEISNNVDAQSGIGTYKYVAVGKKAAQGAYSFITVVGNAENGYAMSLEENVVSSTKSGSVEFRDVFVRKDSDEEINFVFVGSSQTTMIENIVLENAGSTDAVIVILDSTGFSNYEDINILQNSLICEGGSTSCTADELLENYRLSYGTKKIKLSSSGEISSENVGTFFAYHLFENAQGIKFILGRDIIVSSNPIAPDFSIDSMGIDKWYLYSRPQNIGANVGLKERKELWTTRYMPVDNNIEKETGVVYYVISGGEFVEDTSERDYTYYNYVKLEDEPLMSSVAFQSQEKAKEFALLQEFARVAFVKEKYDYDKTGINSFQGEIANLATQNYYFVYYIDLSITNVNGCGTSNGALYGNCTEYNGYAFSSLTKIKQIATLIVNKYSSFLSVSNTRFNPKGSVSLPTTDYFKEEMSTEKYMQSTTVGLKEGLHLEVTRYELIETTGGDYLFGTTENVSTVTGKSNVVFSKDATADYKEEGKYVVRYCYNYGEANQNCGASATFVIDRTAPQINYNLTNGNKGVINSSTSYNNPLLVNRSMTVSKIADIDPYAYTLISGQKYYLQCNEEIKSEKCISDINQYVNVAYSYDKEDPNKVFNIVVYDRAGNFVNSYFKVGTLMPKVSVGDIASSDSFVLTVEFYNKNDIDSFNVSYTKSEDCTACANGDDIAEKIMNYINALIYLNQEELKKALANPEYEPNYINSIDLTFSVSRVSGDGSFAGGLTLPKIEIEEIDGVKTYTFVENENDVLPISKGLYKFTLGDAFHNVSEAFGGIGLDKSELYVYVNDDDNAIEDVSKITEKIPMTRDELGDIVPPNVLLVKNPSTYEYVSYLPEDLLNDFNEDMFFTKKFVYIKFKKSEFGIIRISKANNLNTVGGYGTSEESNAKLSCMFKIYGGQVPVGDVGDCDSANENDLIPLANISAYSDYLNSKGIYFVADFNGYYYMAFTEEGTYDIWSEIYVKITTGGATNSWTAIPVYHSFTIDKTAPVLDNEVICSNGAACVGEKDSFVDSDFVGNNVYKVNIGNNDMKVSVNLDLLIGGSVNRLLVVGINGELYNAYSYSKITSDNINGNYITFDETGIYTVKFYDGAKNEVVYTFIIDKSAPSIDKIADINGKDFSKYQQYVEVNFVVSEGSFLVNNVDKNMLYFKYRINGSETTNEITVRNVAGECVIYTGTYQAGSCSVEETGGVKGLLLNFVIPINKDEASRNSAVIVYELNIVVSDYFGNEGTITQSFIFDNLNPYIYFNDAYTPVYEFGESIGDFEQSNMLSTVANVTLGTFNCVEKLDQNNKKYFEPIKFGVGIEEVETEIINCGDTPEMEGIYNNVSIETYEAFRVTYNNYKKNNDNTYTLLDNGGYLSVTDVVYKKKYISFTNQASLEAAKDSVSIYTKGNYVKVTANEYIDPNVTYYDANGNNGVSIQDMYVRADNYYSTCDVTTDRKCMLYKAYDESGKFSSIADDKRNFYTYDTNDYKEVVNKDSIIISDYLNYYYTTETYKVDEGKYLPAATLKNSCVKVNDQPCVMVKEDRIKLKSFEENNFIYYNIINAMAGESGSSVKNVTMSDNSVKKVIVDNRIWQIAIDGEGKQVKFGFGLASDSGRPIIFVAKDGAGNVSSNYLETVISVKDSDAPEIAQVSSVSYEIDSDNDLTASNYIKGEPTYYRLHSVDGLRCSSSTSKFYTKDSLTGDYVEADCESLSSDNQYYLQVENYVSVEDGKVKETGVTYYNAVKEDLGDNYLTSKNMIIEFNEPIYKIECSYYVYDAATGEGIEKYCSFHNAEFDYSEDVRVFELIYEPTNGEVEYFVNYRVVVYDFSDKPRTVNSLFIDRENPAIKFNDNVKDGPVSQIEVNYTDTNDKSKYNENYLNPRDNENGFIRETTSTDSINNRIVNIGAANIENVFSYEIKYYRYNYNITYKNYVLVGNTPIAQLDGEEKDPGTTYYVLVKKPSYTLKGNSGICTTIGIEQYCYVKDEYNYYPSLVENSAYWIELDEEDYYIKNNSVGVYKIEYQVTDYSGNKSDILIKTVYCNDTTMPVLMVNNEATTNKYGYHRQVTVGVQNEKESMMYSYNCKSAATTCELPHEIFAPAGSALEYHVYTGTDVESLYYESESIYKIYFHDKGNYIPSTNGDGEEMMVLKYNSLEYTFLIDRKSPELYLNAGIDDNGNLYYQGHLDKEEYLYCVSADRNTDIVDLSFGDTLVECKLSSSFSGEWANPSDYVNMSAVYEYADASNSYKLVINNGLHKLYKNSGLNPYSLTYVNDTEYRYSDGTDTYIVQISGENYKLKINGAEYVDLLKAYTYKDSNSNIEYKFVSDGTNNKLFVNDVEYALIDNSGTYSLDYSVYNYISGVNTFKLEVINDKYFLTDGSDTYELINVSEGEYSYEDATNSYRLVISEGTYTLYKNGSGSSYELSGNVFMSYAIRYMNGTYQIRVTDKTVIVRELYNSNGQLIYVERYEKVASNAQKYFYNTYYKMLADGSLREYSLDEKYDLNNVYIIKSIDVYFRNDGHYLFKAQDKSGNVAGRITGFDVFDKDSSSFTVDNTAPSYNKGNTTPTGVNYWYSVPSQVITTSNIIYVNNISKNAKENGVYNLETSNLNNSFFYAFATKEEAETYLIEIYRKHINSLNDNTCTVDGAKGFNYSYYNPGSGTIEPECFVGKNGVTNKNQAQEKIRLIIKELIYPTFSGAKLFGDSSINQKACDSTVSKDCLNNKGMYKLVYLKIDSTDKNNVTKSIVESCVEGANIECVKVNAKIVRYDPNAENIIGLEIGSKNAKDTNSINVYSKAINLNTTIPSVKTIRDVLDINVSDNAEKVAKYCPNGNSSTPISCVPISLNSNSYYIFEENDTEISYANYPSGQTIKHFNTSYYAIYVDNNEYIDVYYDDGNGISDGSLTQTGRGVVKTNVNEYYLIIKNDGSEDFENRYEIYMTKDGNRIIEIYSYIRLKIDGIYYNINDYLYLNDDHTSYYFKIPMAEEKLTTVEFIDRAGNTTTVEVSRSKKAPTIDVAFNGTGGSQTASVIIQDTSLTKTKTETIQVLFSTTGLEGSYSNDKTSNIRASLLCVTGQQLDYYGCVNTGAANGANTYRVVISNLEDLYGFFRVSLSDNHGNSNVIDFMYNPADMSANYTANMKFIDANMDEENDRMITNEEVKLEFDNVVNYAILYKLVDGEFIEVCNTKSIVEGKCQGENTSNKVEREIDGSGQYVRSFLHYVEEGIYKARIVNRASEVINNRCFVSDGSGNLTVKEDCKNIKTHTSAICSWEENPDYCDDALDIINREVVHIYNNAEFNIIEVDKTLPEIDESTFVVSLPTGNEPFVNNSIYTNAEVTIGWTEDLVQLVYTCKYVGTEDQCNGNSTGFAYSEKEYLFAINSKLSTQYEFWFEDYAGNTTENNKYSFTVNIVLPEIAVYMVDDNGLIIENGLVEDASTINKNVQLLCYVEGQNDNRCSSYDVKLERFNGSGYVQVILQDVTRVSENYGSQTTYKYTISIRNAATGYVYPNLKTEFIFTIDKQAPSITVEGDLDELWGIYKGEVRILVSGNGVGTIYSGCVSTGIDEYGDDIYVCSNEPMTTFTSNTKLDQTGSYMVIAEDEVGNVTKGKEIKYIRIDNETPEISIKSKGQYLNYSIAENGFTNAEAVIIEVSDNNDGSYFKYRIKNTNDEYGEWITHSSNYLELTEQGFYEIIPIDAVGNAGYERHFIIYRQAPKYNVMVDNVITTVNDILTKSFYIYWENRPLYSYEAPIVKVTVNGVNYPNAVFGKDGKPTNLDKILIKNSGEYLFEFTDLAGNVTSRKIAINKSKNICLNNVGITPKGQYLVSSEDYTIYSGGYKYSEDDVVILASATNYFGGSSACGENALNYKTLTNSSYFVVENYAATANKNKKIPIVLNQSEIEMIDEIGGFFYAIIVDIDVAKDDLNFPIGENFFTKDPLGWSLVFIFGAAVIYVGVRLIFFRKKVRVLK